MKHVRRVAILCLMLSGLMTAVLSGCGGNDPTEGKEMDVKKAADEFSEEE